MQPFPATEIVVEVTAVAARLTRFAQTTNASMAAIDDDS